MKYRWKVEARVVSVLRRALAPGDEFEAEERIGKSLVAQGLAEAITPKRTRRIVAPVESSDET